MFFKIGVLQNFISIHRKTHLSESLLIRIAGLRAETLLARDSNTAFFLDNITKLLRTVFFIKHLWWFLLSYCMLLFRMNLSNLVLQVIFLLNI